MKRPEGFDPPGMQQPGAPPARRQRQQPKQQPTKRAPSEPVARTQRAKWTRGSALRPDPTARANLRRAARERRRVERAEVRRFTRRARNRRVAVAAVAGTIATLIALVFVAVYSPILALRTIAIDGTARLDPAELAAAVNGQLGTPLALIDFDRMTTELSSFPLIRSYVTVTVPPDTLVIHIVERQPVGSIRVGDRYRLVDPAGVTVQEATERTPGVPVIDLGGADVTSPAFASVVEVLLALPLGLLAQVDSASARSRDDVTLVLTGVGQSVSWGSADESVRKAALLAALIAVTDPARAGEFDVSAPGNGVFRPG